MATPNPDIEQTGVKGYKQMVKDHLKNKINNEKEQKRMYIKELDSYYT